MGGVIISLFLDLSSFRSHVILIDIALSLWVDLTLLHFPNSFPFLEGQPFLDLLGGKQGQLGLALHSAQRSVLHFAQTFVELIHGLVVVPFGAAS